MQKIAVISGGSSGIGLNTALSLVRKGIKVYELSRSGKDSDGINHITADVTNIKQINSAVEKIINQEGRIDIVINNAGFGISGAIEFTDVDDAKRLFDVDFFGAVNLNNAIIPYMRKQKCGRIVNISSVAAVAAIPFQSYYSSAKAAISSYSQSLATELRPFGITVCAILPGDIKTGFTKNREKSHKGDDIYCGIITKSVLKMEKDEQNGMSAETAGKFISRVALKISHKPIYSIGLIYKIIVVLLKVLPYRLSNYLVGKLYT